MLVSAETTAIETMKKTFRWKDANYKKRKTAKTAQIFGSNMFFSCRPFDWRVHFRN